MTYLAIDPGVKWCGVAAFGVTGELLSARLAKTEEVEESWTINHDTQELWIEYPRVYGGRSSRGDTQDLLDLAYVVGRLAFAFDQGYQGRGLHLVHSQEWKGQAKKEVTQARAKRELSEGELARVQKLAKSKAHNVWDAVAIGLWAVGRVKR